MKLILSFAFVIFSTALMAQSVHLNGYAGYVFDDSFDSYYSSSSYYNGKIKGGLQWGVGLEYKPQDQVGVELLYYRQDTKANVDYYGISSPVKKDLDVSVNYILLAGNKYFKTGQVEPYAGLLVGAAILNNKSATGNDETSISKFALGGRLGANIWVSDKVGIKLQAQLMTAVQGWGGGFYFGTGGAGTGVSTYSTITQLGLGGGLVFKLK